MATQAIISYDDTQGDHDALALGSVLADAGIELLLAYVRHTTQTERRREEIEEHEAEALLERGAQWLGDPDVARRVVVSGSTPEGLKWLAEQEEAEIVVFGSDYRTPPGRVAPQHSAQALLEGGTAAVAIAPAGYAQLEPRIRAIGLLAAPGDDAALETASELADRFNATLTRGERRVDLLVVGSRPEAPAGTVMISAQSERAIEDALSPVLVVPRGVPVVLAEPAALA